jgi:hypothetical protein
MSETELESRKYLTKQVKKLERKIKSLEKERDTYRNRYNKQCEFEYEFRKFYVRFNNRKYDTEWPFWRFVEAIQTLSEKLNR